MGGSSAEREGDTVVSRRIGSGRRFAEVVYVITAANEAAAGNFAPLMVILSAGEGTAGTKTGGAPFADGCIVADRRFARRVIARAFPPTETRFTT